MNLAEPMQLASPPRWVELDPGQFVNVAYVMAIEQAPNDPDRCLVYGHDGSVWGCPSSAASLVEHLAGDGPPRPEMLCGVAR